MSEDINDGGTAFPSESERSKDAAGNTIPYSPGMSLRDWFAGQVMAALVVAINAQPVVPVDSDTLAAKAYAAADAMLASRLRRSAS